LYLDVDQYRFIWYILARLAARSWHRLMVTIATSAALLDRDINRFVWNQAIRRRQQQ
jgi:hypothetical protein